MTRVVRRVSSLFFGKSPMNKCRLTLALVLVLGLGWTPAGAQGRTGKRKPPPVPVQHLQEVEKQVYRLTNEARVKQGLPPLIPDATLGAAALAHSEDMLRRHFFSHVSPDGLSPRERLQTAFGNQVMRGGENIWNGFGYNYRDSKLMARTIVDSWLNSSEHRANILNPYFSRLGVGVAVSGSEVRATQNFVALRH